AIALRQAELEAAHADVEQQILNRTEELRTSEAHLARKTALVQLLQTVAMAANEADTFEQALRTTLRQVCAYTGWPIGHACSVLEETDGEAFPEIWDLEEATAVEAFSSFPVVKALRFAPGEGLAGLVQSTGGLIWSRDVQADPRVAREAAAVRAG